VRRGESKIGVLPRESGGRVEERKNKGGRARVRAINHVTQKKKAKSPKSMNKNKNRKLKKESKFTGEKEDKGGNHT